MSIYIYEEGDTQVTRTTTTFRDDQSKLATTVIRLAPTSKETLRIIGREASLTASRKSARANIYIYIKN